MNARALFPALRGYRLLRRPTDPIFPSSPRPVRRDCHGRLMSALLDLAGANADIIDDGMTPWASATFVGARHGMTLLLRGDDAATKAHDLASQLPESEFSIPGHLVADLAVESQDIHAPDEIRLRLSILTIEQW